MDDIVFSTKTRIKSSNTYNSLFSINENGTYSLRIVAPLKPIIKGSNLEFITGEVDPTILGINTSPQHILQLWENYQQQGFPLEDILQALYYIELREFLRSWQTPTVTLLAEIVILLDSFDKCKQIIGFSKRITQDKRKILDLVDARNTDKKNIQKNRDINEKIYSMHNEYLTAYYVNEIVPIELTDDIGKPDFKVIDNDILIDTKMRFTNDKSAYKDPNSIDLTNRTIFSLLMRDGFAPLERAFDQQNADIAMVNLSLSSYGFLLSTGLITVSNFKSTLTNALNMVKNNDKAVIFYTIPRGTINKISAICFKRSIVDNIGGNLDRLDKQFYHIGNKKNFSEFATFVNGLQSEYLKDFGNDGGIHIEELKTLDIDK